MGVNPVLISVNRRRARKLLTTRRVRFSIEDLVLPELRPRLEYRERGRYIKPTYMLATNALADVEGSEELKVECLVHRTR